MLNNLKEDLKEKADSKKAKKLMSFFKTGDGQYGQGDLFLGIVVPEQRKIAKEYKDLKRSDLQKLISSKVHDHRSVALFILTGQYQRADKNQKKEIVDFYLKNIEKINNWDLVDNSAYHILGDYFLDKNKDFLHKLAKSENLWKRRIAIMTTFGFIKQNKFIETFKIAKILLNDKHDLIHKAVGWMLREAGNRDFEKEEVFLKKHYKQMPRTMLRYAIEKFPEKTRQDYLKGRI